MAKYSVLIIDDDVWMQRILSKTLSSYGFSETHLAFNGFEGVALAVEHRPTLIILDILMPELTGHLTLKVLKHIKITKDIPVLMVSAMSDVENLGKAVKTGAFGFISKPFTRATIYEKLIEVFGKEMLDMIASGQDVEGMKDYYKKDFFEKKEVAYKPMFDETENPIDLATEIAEENDTIKGTSNPPQGKLQSYYMEDDKKTIDSIKKLLLKNKK